MLFGVNVSTAADSRADPVADAFAAEKLGFDFVSASDHPGSSHATFETWTMLSWIAAHTSKIRVASRVLGVPYRSPAMVAKMAETLDRLSAGRLILGLGGGYSDNEFRSFGLRVPTAGEKIAGLEEAVRVIRGLWSEQRFTYSGRHHHAENADLEPKPDHHIPIWLGTFGPRALAVTGRVADGWIPSYDMALPEDVPAMKEKIFDAAQDAGRDPNEITLAYNIDIRVDDRRPAEPGVVSGSPDALIEELRGFATLGFTAMNLMPSGPGVDEQVERLGREVVPAVRAAVGSAAAAS